jgi:hypothetical protein
MDRRELLLQALYLYKQQIGRTNSIEFSEDVQTAQVDEFGNVIIGDRFFDEFIKNVHDAAFVLGHESAHPQVRTLLAFDYDINVRYSILINRGWETNYLEDLFINLSLFHEIPSNLIERYYAKSDWQYQLLQRLPEGFDRIKVLKTLTDEQTSKLEMFKIAAVEWYRDEDYTLGKLMIAYKMACDFLISMPIAPSDETMVKHEKAAKEDKKHSNCEGNGGGSGNESDGSFLELKIPLDGQPLSHRFRNFNASGCLQNLLEEFQKLSTKIEDDSSDRRQDGYHNPDVEDLIMWELDIYTPWTEAVTSKNKRDVLVIFDVSQSMFPFLSLLQSVRSTMGESAEYWAFSTMAAEIVFDQKYAYVKTGFGTDLGAILQILARRPTSDVIIVTDGEWTLEGYAKEHAENILKRHNITVLRRGTSKLNRIDNNLVEIVNI